MKVVLEGPDNAGKTTLADKLRHQVNGLKYYHPGGAPPDALAEATGRQTQQQMFNDVDCILFDRVTCVSQQVYNPHEVRDPTRRFYAFDMVEQSGLVVIYCRPNNEVLMDVGNFKWRPDETEEHRQKIIGRAHEFVERYDKVMLTVPCITYDWRDQVHAEMIERMLVKGLYGRTDAVKWFKDVISCGGRA